MRKAALRNLGCKVNAYETEAMGELLERAGYRIVDFGEKADVYVVNTCSVTNVADRKSRQMLHRAKKQNPEAAVVAVGCYAQVAAETLEKDPSVDLIIGTGQKSLLPRMLEDYFRERDGRPRSEGEGSLWERDGSGGPDGRFRPEGEGSLWERGGSGAGKPEAVEDISRLRRYEDLSIGKMSGHIRAYLKIQDGCDQFCSYCVIPYARGRVRSRRPEEILREAENLVKAGFRELVVTGIHISSYGLDQPAGERLLLEDLLERLDGTAGLERLRLGSLEPRIVTEEFARRLSGLGSLCPHFHLSLQSGSDTVLRRMNRRYTADRYRESCAILRGRFDNPAITTDVIAGFPGETEEEFAETERLVREIGFYELHVFPYSRREGTRAAAMPDQVPEAVKRQRAARLLELDRELSLRYRQSFLGRKTEVLMEEKMVLDGREYLTGHNRQYVKGAIPWDESRRGTLAEGTFARMLTDEVAELV